MPDSATRPNRGFHGTHRAGESGKDVQRLARRMHIGLSAIGARRMPGGNAGRHAVIDRLLGRALTPLTRRLVGSETPQHRELARLLRAAIESGDRDAVFPLLSTAGRRPDRRAEKILSKRYRFLWLCNPKVASRSLIGAILAADPAANLIRGRTLPQVYALHPEARDYLTFAFLRHPWTRLRSFFADKHALARHDRRARRWFIDPWHGLEPGMSFEALCRWLNTPCGSDAFADRHWLSQSCQVTVDGRAPDFLGRYERLEADWRSICERTGLPCAPLPLLNAGGAHPRRLPLRGDRTVELVRRRYAADFELGGYGDPGRGLP